ncbi:MAG: type 3 domain protein [Streptosporangiaceae bacterium]|jgi:uncharacterized protein YraI|nr:type 3 domain protein [Streptosporangiaceae bacterium]
MQPKGDVVTFGKTIAALLTVCAAAGWSTATAKPAAATTATAADSISADTVEASRHAATCAYRLSHVRRAGYLNVRSGPGTGYRPVGKLRANDGRVTGACRSGGRWVKVKSSNGRYGWASANYLRSAPYARLASYPTLSCGYRLSHVRRAGYLNVRSGPGADYRRVGKLRAADGRITGACQPRRRWVAVNSSNGKAGWSDARYLRKVA